MEQIKEEKLLLSDCLSIILEFQKTPDEEHQKKLDDLMKKFKIRSYMSLSEKKVLSAVIVNSILQLPDDNDVIQSGAALVINKIIFGLLAYVYNLENDLYNFAAMDACYDALYEYGFVDYILQFCKEDYSRLEKMIDDSLNFANINRLTSLADILTVSNLEDFSKLIKDMKTTLTPEMLKNLKSILNAEAPEWQAFKESIADKAMDDVINRPSEKAIDTLGGNETDKK